MIGGLFAVRSRKIELEEMNKSVLHQRDCSRDTMQVSYPSEDDAQMLYESIRDCFVTGKWSEPKAELDDDGKYRNSFPFLHVFYNLNIEPIISLFSCPINTLISDAFSMF